MDKIDEEILKKMLEEDRLKKMLEEESVEIEYIDKKLAEYDEPIIEPKVEEIKPHPFIEVKDEKDDENKPPADWKVNIGDAREECEAKFGRFKKLCLKIDDKNEWVIFFCKEVNLRTFLFTISSKLAVNPKVTIDDIYKGLLETTKVSDEIVGNGVRDIVKRYVEYFLAVVKSMN